MVPAVKICHDVKLTVTVSELTVTVSRNLSDLPSFASRDFTFLLGK
jgi:hypothetical protein